MAGPFSIRCSATSSVSRPGRIAGTLAAAALLASAAACKWFDLGGSLKLDETVDSATMVQQLDGIQGLMEKTKALGLTENEPDSVRAAAAEFILEGPYAHRRISRNEERGFLGEERPPRRDPGDRRERERDEKDGKGERPNFRRGYN